MNQRTNFNREHKEDGVHRPGRSATGYAGDVLEIRMDPPGAPNEEDAYIIDAPAIGEWIGHEKQIAYFRFGEWFYTMPTHGCLVKVHNENSTYIYKSNTWYPLAERFSRASLLDSVSWNITHSEDVFFKRVVQVYHDKLNTDVTWSFSEASEAQWTQEDNTKTSFSGDSLHLQGYASGPYGHWHLNELSGVNVADSSGNGRNGTGIGVLDTDWVPGKLNNCLNLESNKYVSLGNIANFEKNESFSVECWIKTSEVTAGIMSKYNGVNGWALYFATSNLYFMLVHNASANDRIRRLSTVSINDGLWHHIVATYDGSGTLAGTHIYVDGILRDSAVGNTDTLTGSIIDGGLCFLAALHNWLAYRLDGEIDECLIYDYALTQGDVTFRWNGGAGTEVSGYPVGNWYVHTNVNQLNTSGWDAIKSIVFSQTEPANTQLRYLFSVDNRVTWKRWNGAAWVNEILANIHTNGNTKVTLEALTEANWDLLFSAGTLDIAIGLKTTSAVVTPDLDLITIQYSLPGKYKCKETQIDIILDSATKTLIKNISGGTLEDLGAVIMT